MTKKKSQNPRPDIDTSIAERGWQARKVREKIHDEIWKFSERLVKKYTKGDQDHRKQIAHLMEQCGISVRQAVEKEQRVARDAEFAATREAEKRAKSEK